VNGVADGPVLVTGGAGFLGRHLVDQLIGVEGREVRVIDPQPWAPPPGGAAIAGSILDPEALDRAMRGVAELHHLAAHAHLFARDSGVYERVNVEGTRAVLEAAKRHAVKRIVVVSSAVILRGWNDPDPSPVTEAGPIPPRSAMAGPYSRSKREADGLVRRAVAEGLPAVTLYPTVPLGPGDHGMTAPTRMLAMLLERPPPAYLECRLDLVPVTDLAALCRLAARRSYPGARYVACGEGWRFSAILERVGRVTGRSMPRRRVPFAIAHLASLMAEPWARHVTGRPPEASIEAVRLARHPRHYDGGLAARELGWKAGDAAAALEATLAWLGAGRPAAP